MDSMLSFAKRAQPIRSHESPERAQRSAARCAVAYAAGRAAQRARAVWDGRRVVIPVTRNGSGYRVRAAAVRGWNDALLEEFLSRSNC